MGLRQTEEGICGWKDDGEMKDLVREGAGVQKGGRDVRINVV